MTQYLPVVLDVLLILLTIAGIVALVYTTIILVRVNTLLGRIEVLIGYVSHIQRMLQSWEALPKMMFNWVLGFLTEKVGKKRSSK